MDSLFMGRTFGAPCDMLYPSEREEQTMDMMRIGAFLAKLRKENGLTQEELGQTLGVSNKTVSRWETGTYLPPVEMLQRMSERYGVSINEILSGERLSAEDYREKAEENIKSGLMPGRLALEYFIGNM